MYVDGFLSGYFLGKPLFVISVFNTFQKWYWSSLCTHTTLGGQVALSYPACRGLLSCACIWIKLIKLKTQQLYLLRLRLQYVRQHSFLTNEWQYILYADQWAWHEHMCSLSETLQLRSFITLSIINTKKQPLSNVLVIFCPAIYLIISSPCIHVEKKTVYFESRHSCNLQLDYRLKVVTQLIVMFAT